MRSTRAAVLGAIALSVPAWWLALFTAPAFRAHFVPAADWGTFQSLLVPDLCLAAATLTAAVATSRRQLQPLVSGITIGGWGYATVWTVAASWRGQLPVLDAAAMVAGFLVVSYTCHAAVSQSTTGVD